MQNVLAAVIQLNSGPDPEQNRQQAGELISRAAGRGAQLVALPEFFTCIGPPDQIVAAAEPLDGPTRQFLAEMARTHSITLVGGSFPEQTETLGRIRNCSLIFGPQGELLSCYRKIHLFDIDLPDGVTFCESSFVEPGSELALADSPVGRIGQSTCYDLRFPELFRRLSEERADVFVVPAAFALATGRDHWEVLLRARAIENQVFVVAPGQHGKHGKTLHTFGRSMIIDPWGTVLATATDGPGIALAELDFERMASIRRHLPSLASRTGVGGFPVAKKPAAD